MPQTRILQKLHFISTLWFALSVIFIVALSLYQAGYNWFIIFSLSGYSIGLLYPIIAFYILAVFKGTQRAEEPEIEHPLTNTAIYNIFYSLCPLLGACSGLFSFQVGIGKSEFILNLSVATLIVTFMVWIIIDPLVTVIENNIPGAHEHRQKRQEAERLEQERLARERDELLQEMKVKEENEKTMLTEYLKPYATQLSDLITNNRFRFENDHIVIQAGEIGLIAWQRGGMEGMKLLQDLTLTNLPESPPNSYISAKDIISIWWDGIGDWKHLPISIFSRH